MGEFVGYRVNAKAPCEKKAKDGFVTVYAERRNIEPALGEYGGDAYPIASAVTDGEKYEYGIILAADGVGQGAYTHPSFQSYLEEHNAAVAEEDKNFAKLSCFLRLLYGGSIFDEENAEVLEYATRCFADVPADGFFISPDEESWKSEENAQIVTPFFMRDSQSLGSRILCVYVYFKFRNYMRDKKITVWTADAAKDLRDEINGAVKNELTPKVLKLFKHSDTSSTTKQMRYFLCSTVAVWFYALNKSNNHVSALSLNCGDARTYVVNGKDGVRQISVDDALPDGAMTGFFHFGSAPKTDGGYCDNTLFARIVEEDAPCMLFACSDGVYDTCPAKMKDDGKKYSLPYGDTSDANDFLFTVNMLQALRRSYSAEDFKREVVFNFYAQSSAQGVSEATGGEAYAHVKRDDSGTLAARFFGTDDRTLAILEVLRNNPHTATDELYAALKAFEYDGVKIPYYLPHVQSVTDAMDEEKSDYATGAFMEAMRETVKSMYHDLYTSMIGDGAQTIWNVQHTSPTELAGFGLNQKFVKVVSNYTRFLDLAIEDWTALLRDNLIAVGESGAVLNGLPEEWKLHEHIICKEDIFELLKRIGFEAKYAEFTSGGSKVDTAADITLKLYDWFEERFSGRVGKTRDEVWCAGDDGRKSVNDAPTPADVVSEIINANSEEPAEPQVEAESAVEPESENKAESEAETAPETEKQPENIIRSTTDEA